MNNSQGKENSSSWRTILDVSATVGVILVSGTLLLTVLGGRWQFRTLAASGPAAARNARPVAPEPPLPVDPVSIDGAALKGQRSAKVAIIEYSDFQCPFCGTFARDVLPGVERTYVDSGKVLLAFRQMPLEQIHANAFKAAEAAACAGEQGKFWQMHDLLFGNQRSLGDPDLHDRARTAGLDSGRFESCLEGRTVNQIRIDLATAKSLAVTGTPTFFFGYLQDHDHVKLARRIGGVLDATQIQSILDPLLANSAGGK